MAMYQRILIASDGTALSRRAEAAGIELAAAIGAEIVVLSVIPKASRAMLDPTLVAARVEVGQVERLWSERAERTVAKVKAAAGKKRLAAKTLTVVADSVADAILAAAKKHRCELIVMASHGRKGLGRVLLGSETQHVLVHTQLPVLVVR
jgi:nucleotide-binding universal stress UspA family protein